MKCKGNGISKISSPDMKQKCLLYKYNTIIQQIRSNCDEWILKYKIRYHTVYLSVNHNPINLDDYYALGLMLFWKQHICFTKVQQKT